MSHEEPVCLGAHRTPDATYETSSEIHPALVLVELQGLLVSSSNWGSFHGVACATYDGGGQRRPVFVHPGAVEFLQALTRDVRCIPAVITAMTWQTCEPILEWLRQQAEFAEEQLLCFDATSMRHHEDHLVFPDRKPRKQYDLLGLCEECSVARGRLVDADRSMLVVSSLDHVRRDQASRALLLAPFVADDVFDPQRQALAVEELRGAQRILNEALAAVSVPVIFAAAPSALSTQSARQQRFQPSPLLRIASAPARTDQAYADGVVAKEPRPLVAVDLNWLLVYRSEVGVLQGASPDGYDGTQACRPFYANPGAVEFLQALVFDMLCVPAVVTSMNRRSCRPILEWLQQEAGLVEDQLLCFDAASMCPHEDRLTFPDGRPRLQRDLAQLCDECCGERGRAVDRNRSLIVVSDPRSVRRDQARRALLLVPFGADDIGDLQRRGLVIEELRVARQILVDALEGPTLPERFPTVPSDRHTRSAEQQHAQPPPLRLVASASEWQEQGQWACAEGVVAKGPLVHSQGKGWAGARHSDPFSHGMHGKVSIRIRDGRTVRVGWAARCAREVGVDRWGYGYGGTARKSHAGKFHPYGKQFGIGDIVTSVLDRTGTSAMIYFLVNGKPVAEVPAFQISEELLDGPLFFALCGTPGFAIELLAADEALQFGSHGDAGAVESMQIAHGLTSTPAVAEHAADDARGRAAHSGRALVLCFNRHPHEFDTALLGSSLAMHAAKRGAEIRPAWANGAKIFVECLTASDAEESRVDLCPRHVVVYEDEEQDVYDALARLPCKIRPRLKTGAHKAAIPSNSNISRFQDSVTAEESDDPVDDDHTEIIVKRTFICIASTASAAPRYTKSWP